MEENARLGIDRRSAQEWSSLKYSWSILDKLSTLSFLMQTTICTVFKNEKRVVGEWLYERFLMIEERNICSRSSLVITALICFCTQYFYFAMVMLQLTSVCLAAGKFTPFKKYMECISWNTCSDCMPVGETLSRLLCWQMMKGYISALLLVFHCYQSLLIPVKLRESFYWIRMA